MAIELNVGQKSAGLAVEDQNPLSSILNTLGAKPAAPVLGGENVKVTSGAMSDLEKLVARLRNESDNMKMSVAQRRLSILQTVLDSMAERVTDSQKDAILELETLDMEKAQLETELGGLNTDKAAAEGRIALLDAQIAALERQIEQAVEDGADHREKVAELKALRANEQAKLDRVTNAIKSVSAKIAEVDGKIAVCTEAIGSATLSEVSAELRTAASEVDSGAERPESAADRRKAEEKAEATDLGKSISESLDRIDEQISRVLEEAQGQVRA